MRKPTFYTGGSIKINLVLKDGDLNPIDLSTLTDIEVKVFKNKSTTLIKTALLSDGQVTIISASAGSCYVVLDGTDTASAVEHDYSVQVKTTEPSTGFSPARYRITQENSVFNMSTSV